MREFKDPAVFTFPFESKEAPALGRGLLPARLFAVSISGTLRMDIFRAIEYDPAWLFVLQEVPHFPSHLYLN